MMANEGEVNNGTDRLKRDAEKFIEYHTNTALSELLKKEGLGET